MNIKKHSLHYAFGVLPNFLKGYKAKLNNYETQKAIGLIHNIFERHLHDSLNISRVSAPLFLEAATGLNDDLSGVERKVDFEIKEDGRHCQIVQSLAKWKRYALKKYDFYVGNGLYTDMNAIRRDEDLDNLHSVYVDQWDWEKVIRKEDRNEYFLKDTVERIVNAICDTELEIRAKFPQLNELTPKYREVFFITSQELLDMYPGTTDKERENAIVKQHHTVCLMKIGGALSDGKPHDLRAPDYDDWSTPNEEGFVGLNGDLLVWNPILNRSMELSSMGIRVNAESMICQLDLCGQQKRKGLYFHKKLLAGDLPLSIGGGIGQSRLCMLLLQKAHIGEIQASIWPEEQREECRRSGIQLI